MNAYHLVELLIVGAAVGFSAWNLAKRFVPQLRGGTAAKTGGCASCDACGNCDSPTTTAKTEQPVRFYRD